MGPIDVTPDPWQRLVAIGSILSVLFVAVGLYLTNKANREQQITDRFTKTVEQLGQTGPEKVDVRLGAIYALERIMRDSANDQPAVVGILAAFIRTHSPAPPRSPMATPAVDIQTAVIVLGRRDITRDYAANEQRRWPSGPDLSNTNLISVNLPPGANLTDTNLANAHLSGAHLANAHLSGVNLANAHLSGANLFGANLIGATLTDATLTGADLQHTELGGAELTSAILTGANLTSAILTGADLTGADLTCARTDDETRLPKGVARPAPCD
ncbi:pentapeptide repeat-containing protein [Micromonospora haikouensis]|uniref:pentapeptide repeat-containing protein n=1 Tax=Micromonospora haikouensis TaxID=686309 RepID=UPI003434DA51